MYNFADTETNGFLNKNVGPTDPKQGRVVQLAALLTDEKDQQIDLMNTLIRPDGWLISERLVEIHGITTQMCYDSGILMPYALDKFMGMCLKSKKIIFHNADFDISMLLNECLAYTIDSTPLTSLEVFCTMKATTDICKIPKARGYGWKWPKLQEAHKHFFGAEFENAHDALADLYAMKRIFIEMHKPVVPIVVPVIESAKADLKDDEFSSGPI